MIKLLVIDNYDSFTYNLTQMFMENNINLKVYRHDEISINKIKKELPDYALISPGPKNPNHSGISIDFIKNFYSKIPILGICLGMQCISKFFGGQTIKSIDPMHGKKINIFHNGKGLFKGIPSPFKAARYNSLLTEQYTLFYKNSLIVNAWSYDGSIMGISHPTLPIHGLQFHPESFLTDYGFKLIKNFLKLKNIKQ